MLFHRAFFACCALAAATRAQTTLVGSNGPSTTNVGDSTPTGGFESYSTTRSLDTTAVDTLTSSETSGTGTSSSSRHGGSSPSSFTSSSSTSATVTIIGGANSTVPANSTGTNSTSTSTSAQATNTQPCNGHPEFCNRRYSNITHVAAHNSPFSVNDNAASNQNLDVTKQLNDGIRMLQFQTHSVNGTMYLCHTSCDILNAGTLESYLSAVTAWLRVNRFDVVTILMGNDDVVAPGNYTNPVVSSGLIDFVYTPPTVPMPINKWPTLEKMIISNTRAVVMLDYQANQTAIPWLLDEFAQMFETPFSPTDRSFPCTAQRPPADWAGAKPRSERMYMANHNLNVNVSIGSFSLLTPAFPLLNVTNSDLDVYGSLERTRQNCTGEWNRPPNFLLVDYYNIGNFNGSVFQVAANANNVTYDRDSCCGTNGRSFGIRSAGMPSHTLTVLLVSMVLGLLLS
ncbi:MAG: hypothetical protein Q9227_006460 [Pyrenula ochraceoflavens]